MTKVALPTISSLLMLLTLLWQLSARAVRRLYDTYEHCPQTTLQP